MRLAEDPASNEQRRIPQASAPTDDQIRFCAGVLDDSGVAGRIEAQFTASTGRPRTLSVRALLVALFVLAIDDRPLHLSGVTRLLFTGLSGTSRSLSA